MMKTAPDPKDIQEFLFKQSHIHQLVDAFASVPIACNLVAADKKRGLLYAAYQNKLVVLKPGEDSDPEWKLELELPVTINKIALSCNCSYLAVAPHMPCVLIYDTQALAKNNLLLLHEIRVSAGNGNIYLNDLKWNPTVPEMLCTVASDYTVGNFQIKEKERTVNLEGLERLSGRDVLCAAWSPKGKQIVAGCRNGSIIQLKPDLKLARVIPGPMPYIGGVISILWISNYQFCAAYLSDDQQINVLIIDAPKGTASANFTCYEDITYGMPDAQGEGGVPRYYFDHVPEWGVIIAASSRSSEIAMLGSTDAGATWNQWQLVDSGRAQLPLIGTTESYPVGMAIDKSPSQKLPWGADATLPEPVPILHILGTSGQLCSFHMVNLTPNCPMINSPPTEIVAAPPQARPSLAPAETSMLMSAVATSTPQRPKQVENIPERQKPPPATNLFGDSLKTTGFFQQASEPEKPQLKPQEQKPPPPPAEPAPKVEPVKELQIQEPPKVETKPPPIKETPQETAEQKIIDESICVRAYVEEQSLFEKDLLSRQEPNVWECGTEEERKQLAERAATIDQFLRELRETTTGLSSEIAYLKALLLQSFAWVEETKSKNAASNNISSRGPGDNSKMNELQTLYYYTQTQLTQATKILDLEWSDKMKMKIPSLEFLYQNLMLHNKIVTEEKKKLVQLKKRWKSFGQTNSVSSLNSSLSNLEITSSKSTTSLKGNPGIIEARCKAIASRTLSFRPEKQMKLRNLLCRSTPRVIKPVNPSPIHGRLEATLSSLASRASLAAEVKGKIESPVTKQSVPAKPLVDKTKQQSPLASLNSIVARIGSAEANGIPAQAKPQVKPTSTGISIPTMSTKLFPQLENKQSPVGVLPLTPPTKPKQEVTPSFGQLNTVANNSVTNILKGFPKMDAISFGAAPQKLQDIQNAQRKDTIKSKEPPPTSEIIKSDSNLFSTGSLNDVLTSVLPASKPQESINNAPQFSSTSLATITPKTDAMPQFMMNTNMTTMAGITKTTQEVPSTTAMQKFSFASRSVTVLLKNAPGAPAANPMTPTTPTETQQPQDLSMLSLGVQPSTTATSVAPTPPANVFASKPSTAPAANQGVSINFNGMSISLVKANAPKGAGTAGSTVSIEEIPTTPTTSAPSPGTSSIPAAPAAVSLSDRNPLFGFQSTTPANPIFGGNTATPASSTLVFGSTPTTTSKEVFGGFAGQFGSPTTTGSPTVTTSSTTSLLFPSNLSKPSFSEATATSSTPSISGTTTTPSATPSFGGLQPASTASSIFGQSSSTFLANNQQQLPTTTAVSSPSNAFAKPIVSPSTMSFASFATEPPAFSNANTSFGNNWVFGGAPAGSPNAGSNTNMFGGGTPASPASNVFGAASPSMNTFGTPSTGSVFGGGTQKPGPFSSPNTQATSSFFGGNTTAPAPAPAMGASSPGSVFNTPTGANPQMGFGQAPAFGAKPQGSMFGGEPIFGSGFGTSMFGGGSANPHAFGAPAAMGGPPASMDNKVFGSTAGSDTFESLATQPGGLTFGSLAQKSPEPAKTNSFGGGSSFSTWR